MSSPENKALRHRSRAVILGCGGPVLGDAERRFFRDADPLGFILFARNCKDPDQVRNLIAELRDCVGRADAPVLIDQEGGRVARLGPPHWRAVPPARRFAEIAGRDRDRAVEAARLNAHLIAAELFQLGITVNCAPVLDVAQTDAHPIIGDRAYGGRPEMAALLGWAVCEGLVDGGVMPVIKHIPGHGRAMADSHEALPVVVEALADLDAVDFAPFRALNHMPWAMTAHVVYRAIDPDRPATTSAPVIAEAIRGAIGFDGVLLSDDIAMKALDGDIGSRARAALAAGCDVVLHCSGALADMKSVTEATGLLSDAALDRLARGAGKWRAPVALNTAKALVRLDNLFDDGEVTASG
ncbi:MAG TPA: beta-N-acetylhexosaminidase [Rhodospirillales bacterium]|nr:beta-N-acetylhexosaminidase [Rhodospirillales bacterium]